MAEVVVDVVGGASFVRGDDNGCMTKRDVGCLLDSPAFQFGIVGEGSCKVSRGINAGFALDKPRNDIVLPGS
jgi:hypothetical protein